MATSDCFVKGLRSDATGNLGITPLIKVLTDMRMIAYGIPADLCDDAFEVSETTDQLCLDEFCKAVASRFGSVYLRAPTEEDLVRIDWYFRNVGFPGCIDAVDCAGWIWNKCQKSLQGIMVGKERTPVLRLESICDVEF